MGDAWSSNNQFLGLEDAVVPDQAGCIILPAPFEQTSTYGSGSCRGPQAIIQASHQVETFDAELGFTPHEAAGGIATLPPLNTNGLEGESLAARLCETCRPWLDAGKRVITLGGEHTSVVGAIRAHVQAYPETTVLVLDAHSDLRDSYNGSPWNHACTAARVLDFHGRLVQVGIRSQCAEEREYAGTAGVPIMYAHSIHQRDRDREDWTSDVIASLSESVYISFDCDAMDPSVVPATGTPEPGGLSWSQVNHLLARLCSARKVIGFDVSELAPRDGLAHADYAVAKFIYRAIGYMCLSHMGPRAHITRTSTGKEQN